LVEPCGFGVGFQMSAGPPIPSWHACVPIKRPWVLSCHEQ